MKQEILKKLNEIFRSYFDDENISLTESTTANDIDDWDSLAQVGLILSIEKTFLVKFSGVEIEVLANVGEMVELINEKK